MTDLNHDAPTPRRILGTKSIVALLGMAFVGSLLVLAAPASASCTGVNVGSDCYGLLNGCTEGGPGVGHSSSSSHYDWCYVSVKTGSTTGVCSNVEFTYNITCVGLLATPNGNCIGTHTYGGDGSDRGYTCLV